ncbi:MAG: glutamine--fructose-6-phosphate transaminase (isomerizing) [Candidatus Moranbacteria bacterium]|nr:glutamine--fructose-6-phosphate transaminase (isomerizing) [Candidatus Moranbacteria bacterium]
MCGIVGYIGKRPAQDFLLEGLKRLEYRGYDSAGIALLDNGKIKTVKALGKVAELQLKMERSTSSAMAGIAHTRWATHGKPSEKNAHPHIDCKGDVAVVHNGIIENYRELKEALGKRGHAFRSETDTEVIAHLLEEEMSAQGRSASGGKIREVDFEKAFVAMLKQLKGAYGIVAMATKNPEIMLAARLSSPLVLGIGQEEMFIASDASALVGDVKRIVYLDDNEIAVIGKEGYVVKTLSSRKREKEELPLEWNKTVAEHSGYAHFMLKEIFEQPKSFADALRGRLIPGEGKARLGGLRTVEKRLRSINRIVIVSCGTSYHSALVGEYMLEEYAGIKAEVEMASEFRYRKPLLDKKTAVIAISQSGETADTLAAIREAKEKGALVLGIVNVVGSTIARETDAGVYCHAGPEISVASTKAFTSQLAILALLSLYLGRQRGLTLVMGKRIAKELLQIPKYMERVLTQAKAIKKLAKKYAKQAHYLYLGRKYNYPNALEGALKIKEIAYVPAQGYPTGEMKHGPIALIDASVVSVMIMPKDSVYEKNVSGMEEILARGGKILAIATDGDAMLAKKADVIFIPKTLEMLTPLLAVIPLQLFAYYVAVERGYDIDKPRNLAKSVTVE